MTIKSNINTVNNDEFPMLMKSTVNNTVVFMTNGNGAGVCVYAEGNDVLGEYSNEWAVRHFVKFNGTLTLENK